MGERPEQHSPDDRLDADQPFDAGQWALHGLLCAYYERERVGPEARVRAILERVGAAHPSPERERGVSTGATPRDDPGSTAPVPSRARILRFRLNRRWALGGSLAAALLLALLLPYLLWHRPEARDDTSAGVTLSPELRALAQAAVLQPLPLTMGAGDALMLCGLELAPDESGVPAPGRPLAEALRALDCGEVDRRLAEIAHARQERDALLAAVAAAVREKRPPPHAALLDTWARGIFRDLRALGRFDEALEEIRAALAYTGGDNPTGQRWDAWYVVCLNDLGETLEIMGDYDGAAAAYLDSIRVRQATRHDVAPLFLNMGWLAALSHGKAGLPEARDWLAQAEAPWRDYFLAVCRANGISVPADASLHEVFQALPEEFRSPRAEPYAPDEVVALQARYGGFVPSPSPVAWARCILFHQARLLRVAGDYAGAAEALRQLAAVRPYPFADEWRLEFSEPLENARLALVRGEYRKALEYVAVAEASAGPLECPWEPNFSKRPVGPLALAEAELLRGAALLGIKGGRPEGRRLIQDALAVAHKVAEGVPGAARAEFLGRFETWNSLARLARKW